MKQQQTGLWLLGAFLVAVVIAALAYFLLISPELDKGAVARENAAFAMSDNELLEIQILAAQTKEQQVPEWEEEIGKISLDMPPTVEQADLERLINSTLAKYDLPSLEVTYGRPEQVIGTLTEGYEPPTLTSDDEEGATPSPSPSPSAEPSVAPSEGAEGESEVPPPVAPGVPEPAFAGLVGIPVTIATEGDPVKVLSFMKEMQTQIDRFYTATNFTITKADVTEESPGRVALTEEDVTINISGLVFSLIDPLYSFPGDNEGEIAPYSPNEQVPNAFAPLPGTEESAEG
ncbi:hypothetical protein [Demequina oxidasica]|uniref:hypothetical protein n=1 Tax=Demequina oxidasica TaxID=676199 RepID=UPI00078283BA|nr:hypothetical protein [Demequina oxidasica]